MEKPFVLKVTFALNNRLQSSQRIRSDTIIRVKNEYHMFSAI